MTPLRILLLAHDHLLPPENAAALSDDERLPFKAEWDVLRTLSEQGHDVRPLGLRTDLDDLRKAVAEFRPHVAFNLIESFNDFRAYDAHVVAFLECLRQPYTGCNPRGLMIARDKALTKKILAYHRIRVPAFAVFPLGRAIRRPASLPFPLLVKSVTDDGSVGISLASVVTSDAQLRDRVEFIHSTSGTDAIAEQYIDGRELYLAVAGNRRLRTFPVWELKLDGLPDGSPRIATERVKQDPRYRRRHRIDSAPADLPPEQAKTIASLGRRIYHLLGLSGYARLDFRLTPTGELFLLEANPNPQIAQGEDFADSASAAGVTYPVLLDHLTRLGLRYSPVGLA